MHVFSYIMRVSIRILHLLKHQDRMKSLFLLIFPLLLCEPALAQSEVAQATRPAPTAQIEDALVGDPVDSLRTLLATKGIDDACDSKLASVTLDKSQAAAVKALLIDSHSNQIRKTRTDEWKDKTIELSGKKMKFELKVFGEKPKTGRSLFISMHGGGGAPARVNEQQWRNQIGLYEPEEGVYLAPRAPTDNWNLWHESHIDPMFSRIIENAIAFEDVDPNRIYLMGYSAGGDGVYQLAPRMADQLAAAAMMAGHPNDAQPFGLRNIGFTLHMGGKDAAYKRNEIAVKWKTWLAEIQAADPTGYQHEVVIHPEHGHWMKKDDAVAVGWMSKFTRDPFPNKVNWYQSGVTHDRFYWLAADGENVKRDTHAIARREGQKFFIEKAEGLSSLILRFNDEMIDFNLPVVVTFNGAEIHNVKVNRTMGVMAKTLTDRGDSANIYSAEIVLNLDSKK